jgi:hypothetical protein
MQLDANGNVTSTQGPGVLSSWGPLSGSLGTALRPLTIAEAAVFTAARPRGLNRTNHDESKERRDPGPVGTAAMRPSTAWVLDQHQRAAGCTTRYWPRSCSRAGRARRGCGGSPRSGSPWPSAGPAGGAGPSRSDGHAGVGGSSGAGPDSDASAPAWPAAPVTRASCGARAAVRAQPGSPGRPSRSAAGPPAAAAPRLHGAIRAVRRLRCRTPRQQRKPAHHLAERQIEQSQGHAPIITAR